MTDNIDTQRFGFLLLPEFSMLSFASVVEPLRMANRLAGKSLYGWELYTRNNAPVMASNGIAFTPTRRYSEVDDLTALLVVAGIGAHLVPTDALGRWLRGLSRHGVLLGATSTGTLLLARTGILHDQRCTIHWENAGGLREQFPLLQVSDELYELDAKVITCSGGVAGLDMMLQLIRSAHGDALSRAVAEQCIHPSIRSPHAPQRMALESRWYITSHKLVDAVSVMQSHLGQPLTCAAIARRTGVSMRQLQRLFKHNLDTTPAQYYLDLRLELGDRLLEQSTRSVMDIAVACGFSSSSHFARCYRHRYGANPRQRRRRHPVTPQPAT